MTELLREKKKCRTIFSADTIEAALVDNALSIIIDDGENEAGAILNKEEVSEMIKFLQRTHAKME